MKFKYQAKTKEGEDQVGFVEAGTRESAANILAGHNLYILSIEPAEKTHWYERLATYFSGVRRKDMVVFTRQLATLLEARLSLNKALQTLYEQTNQPVLKEAVYQISQDVDAGLSFSQALERQGNIFSNFFVSLVRSAEVTGSLEATMGFWADYVEKEYVLLTKARGALIYPVIVIVLFLIVAFVMVTFVFPQIQPVFAQAGVQLPFFSQMLINTGTFMGQWWPVVLLGLAILVFVILDYLRTDEGRAFKDDMKIKLPILKRVYMPLVITRFSNAGSMLLRGGVPVAQAMEIVGETVDNMLYRDLLHEVSEDVRQGVLLSEAIAKHPDYFPKLVSQMLSVGEATGKMDQTFERLASFYGREADSALNNLVELIQPALMIAIGLLVGLLFASILVPLYQLTSTIH